MKSILISIKPKWVAKILNGEKTIEIRKTMPKCDFPIDVYIYCTKDKKGQLHYSEQYGAFYDVHKGPEHYSENGNLNGKVVAKFTLNNVEEIKYASRGFTVLSDFPYYTESLSKEDLLKLSCLTNDELFNYLGWQFGYAWHIDNLIIFDRPKELSDFRTNCGGCQRYKSFTCACKKCEHHLTKAPQNLCYVEGEE